MSARGSRWCARNTHRWIAPQGRLLSSMSVQYVRASRNLIRSNATMQHSIYAMLLTSRSHHARPHLRFSPPDTHTLLPTDTHPLTPKHSPPAIYAVRRVVASTDPWRQHINSPSSSNALPTPPNRLPTHGPYSSAAQVRQRPDSSPKPPPGSGSAWHSPC